MPLARGPSATTRDVPTDPRLRLAHRAKLQSATPVPPPSPTVPPPRPPTGSTAGSSTPLSQSGDMIKRSQSAMSWADHRTLLKHETPIPGVDLNQLTFHRYERMWALLPLNWVEKDVWAVADGGIGSSDSEDDAAFAASTSTAAAASDQAMRKAYQVLPPAGQHGQVVYDSSDDDD
ncbi:hypothetical protein JCM3774_004097 [Rhodotorula dairenensis]